MGEISEYLKEKYFRSHNSETKEHMYKQKVKNAILNICDDNLEDEDDELIFEVVGKDLTYAVSVINEEPIYSKYIITQKSDTLFSAKLRSIEL